MSEGPPTSGSGADPGQPAQPEVPAGWYPHPTAPGWEAYWTGSGWGTETRPAPAAAAPAAEQQSAAGDQSAAGEQAAAEQQAAGEQQAAAAEEQSAAEEQQQSAAEPAAETASASAQRQPVAAASPAAEAGRSDSALPVVICVLGAVGAAVGAFLPQASADFNGTSIELADNTMVAAGYGVAAVAAAALAAAVAVWAYLKAIRSWIPILLGAVVVAIAVYAGTAGLDALDDQGTPSTGVFAVAAGGLLIVIGGVGLARENR